MTDDLTELLHRGSEGLPPPRHQPAELRHDAEHRRRVRRATGGTLVALAVVVVALASGVDGHDETAPRPAPARTPTPTAPGPTGSRTFALADQAVLTGKEWHDVTGGPGSRSAIDTRQVHACTPDPRAQGSPTETQAVTYRESQRPGTQLNEYVMRYADEAAAVDAFAGVYNRFAGCRDPAYDESSRSIQGSVPQGFRLLADEEFVTEERLASVTDSYSGPGPFGYQLAAARDDNVVVVIESTGWGDRSIRTLELALARAIPAERARCGPICR